MLELTPQHFSCELEAFTVIEGQEEIKSVNLYSSKAFAFSLLGAAQVYLQKFFDAENLEYRSYSFEEFIKISSLKFEIMEENEDKIIIKVTMNHLNERWYHLKVEKLIFVDSQIEPFQQELIDSHTQNLNLNILL